ncbi:MAG: GAF domain-containing protein, partial [Chitinophagaceae bacterium]
FTPVRLYPVINPITQSFIDLSDCNIRSVASVHLEYLGNMGVQSSMSTRLIVNDGLWGLISCHHRTAFHPGYEMCTVFELLSDVIAAKIAALEKETDYRLGEELQSIRSYLAERLYAGTGISDALVKGEQTILDLLNVEGIAMCLDKTIKLFGKTPDEEQTRNLVQWLQLEGAVETQATSSISHLYEGGNQFTDVASGMIILPVRPESGEYIIGFRPEVIQQVNWGGNPNEAIQFEADNKNYHPRHSFSTWQQQVKHTSLPWHQQEIAIAEQFRTMFLQYKYKNQF